MAKLTKKFRAFDDAVVNLEKAGMTKKLLSALESDPKLLTTLKKIAPKGP